jgi:hypothetical protein
MLLRATLHICLHSSQISELCHILDRFNNNVCASRTHCLTASGRASVFFWQMFNRVFFLVLFFIFRLWLYWNKIILDHSLREVWRRHQAVLHFVKTRSTVILDYCELNQFSFKAWALRQVALLPICRRFLSLKYKRGTCLCLCGTVR